MRFLRFIITVAVLGWFCPPIHVGANSMAQELPTDSIIAPNVFTPNGDGINDVFEVRSREGNKVALNIYTRTGVLVYSITAERCRWDGYSLSGQKMATGIYYFTAEILDTSPKIAIKKFFHLYR